MRLPPFEIERYFARWEHVARHLLSCSDCEPLSLKETIGLADDEALTMWYALSLAYTESQGLPALREEISSQYEGIDPAEVLEVVPEEGIFLAMNALLEPGDRAVVTCPAYQSLTAVAEGIGAEVVPWMPVESPEGWVFEAETLRGLVRDGCRLVVMNFPHNPTGAMPSPESYREMLAIAEGAGATVFSDEMYRGLEYGAEQLPSAVEVSANAVTLSGMSKVYSLPGLRVGWLVCRDEAIRERIASLKDYTTICGSAPAELLALIGLRARRRIVARNLDLVRRNLDAIDEFVADTGGAIGWTRPSAGSVGLARLRDGGAAALCDGLARDAGIMLLPSTVFGFGDSHVRLGFGRTAFPEGLDALSEHLGGPESAESGSTT